MSSRPRSTPWSPALLLALALFALPVATAPVAGARTAARAGSRAAAFGKVYLTLEEALAIADDATVNLAYRRQPGEGEGAVA